MKTVAARARKINRRGAPAAVATDLAGVIDRMILVSGNQPPDARLEGRLAGGKWARTEATPRQLFRLSRRARNGSIADAAQLVAVIRGEEPVEAGDDAVARAFFTALLGDRHEEGWQAPAFVAGFVADALRVWRRVRPHLGLG